MQKLIRKDVDEVRYAVILQNTLDIGVLFCSCSFEYVDIKANGLATQLARFTLNLKNPVIWEHRFHLDGCF